MYLIYFPIPTKPNTICKRPDSRNTARIMGKALLIDPSKLDKISAMKTILTAVIGAVGPDIWVGVPPKKAAKKLIKIAIKNWIAIESKKEIVSNKYRKILKDIYFEDVMALKNKLNYDFPEWEDFKN